jgi:hypothetical protein
MDADCFTVKNAECFNTKNTKDTKVFNRGLHGVNGVLLTLRTQKIPLVKASFQRRLFLVHQNTKVFFILKSAKSNLKSKKKETAENPSR